VIGLLLGIVGVIPLGIAAAGYKGLWFFVVELGFGLILTFAAYAFALYLAGKMDRAAIEEAPILP
jgi:hypothetical protein